MNESVYQTPEAQLEQAEGEESNLPLARRRARWVSSLIDGIIIGIPTWIIFGIAAVFSPDLFVELAGFMYGFGLIILGVLQLVFFFAFNYRSLVSNGQTIGKRLMKNKLIDENGQPPAPKELYKRYGLFYLPNYIPLIGGFFGFINVACILGNEKRCIHDRVAKTRVVRIEE